MSFTSSVKTQLKGSAVVVNNAPGSTTAVSLPGTTGSYVQIDTSQASPNGNNIFIEAWVYFGSIGSTTQTIFSMGSASTEYMSIKVADQGGPEIAGPFTCSLTNGDGTVTTSSAIGRSFTLSNMYYNPGGPWLLLYLPQSAQYWSSFQIQIYITKLAGTPAMSRPDVFVQADFEFDDGAGNWINLGTVDLLNVGVTWPAGIYNTTYTWIFPTGIPTGPSRDNPTYQRLYRFRVRGGGTIGGTFYDVSELLNTNLAVFSGYYNDFRAQANQWNHIAFTWSNDSKTLSSFCNGMWVKSQNQTSAAPLFSSLASVGASNEGTATPFNGYIRDLRIIRGGYPPDGYQDNLYINPNFVPDQTFGAGTVPSYVADGTNVFNLIPLPTFVPVSLRITSAATGCKMYTPVLNLTTTSLLTSTSGSPLCIVVNNYVYYVYGGTNSIFVMTRSGVAVTTVTPAAGYTIKAFGGGLAVDPATGVVYFQYLNGSQWGFGAITPGTYSITYNNTVSFSDSSTGMCFLNGSIYWARGASVRQIDTSTWAVSTYVTYSGTPSIQGITAVGSDLYIMTINGGVFKNTSTTSLVSTQDYWGLTTDGYYLYMGGAGTNGVYRVTIGNWTDRTQIINGGTYNPPGLIISLFYSQRAIYIAGFVNNAIIKLT